MKVVFFKPQIADGQYPSIVSSYGLTGTPGIEAGFYLDLTVKAIDAVESLKKSGSWPNLAYTKCSQYDSDTPIQRRLNLASAIQVLFSLIPKTFFKFKSNRPRRLLKCGGTWLIQLLNRATWILKLKFSSIIPKLDLYLKGILKIEVFFIFIYN